MLIVRCVRAAGIRFIGGCLLGLVSVLICADEFSEVGIKTTQVMPGIYMLEGSGGNIGLSVGEDGVFMIDDQFAPLTGKIQKAVAAITSQPVKFLINTHWHYDHVGGNENFGKGGAIIVAQNNVRERMLKGQVIEAFAKEVPPADKLALPVITFDKEVTFHWNSDTLEVIHVASAHTDGDAVIYFKQGNVVHTGDLYFSGMYPFIDASSGGSMVGLLTGVSTILTRIDDNTKVIPGHGPLSYKVELQAYQDMLKSVYTRVKALKDQGKSVEAVVAAKPSADFDAKWGNGFLAPDVWVKIIYSAI